MSALSLALALLLVQPTQGAPVVNIPAAELAQAPRLTIAGPPIWRIGGDPDGPYGFVRVVGGTFMRNGRLAVLEFNPPELRVFDGSGKHVLSFGRKGRGPGEFERVQRLLHHIGDSLVVLQAFRVSVFDALGKHARTFSTASGAAGLAMASRMFSDGTLLAGTRPMLTPQEQKHGSQRAEGITRDTTRLVVLSARGDAVSLDLGKRPSGETVVVRHDGAQTMTMRAFGSTLLVEAADSFVLLAQSDAARIEVLSAHSGRLLRTIDFGLRPRAVTDRDKEDFASRRRTGARRNGGDIAVRGAEAYLKLMTYPDRMPYFDALRRSFDGVVRLRRYVTPLDSSAHWLNITPAGRLLSVIDVSAKIRVLDFDGDRVLVVERDADDLEYVALYRLVRQR